MADDFDSEREKAIGQVEADKRRFRDRAAYEVVYGIGMMALCYIHGLIFGTPNNVPHRGAPSVVGLLLLSALVSFGLAAAHWCASLRRPAKALTRASTPYTDPEDALAAAFQLEMNGDWDPAIALYGEVAKRWPENEQYAQGHITEIEEKQLRATEP